SRPDMPLYGLAEIEVVGGERGGRRRDGRRQPASPAPEAPPPSDDPLTSALLAWAEPPSKPEPEPTSPAQEAWERLLAREAMERDWFERLERDPDEDDGGDRWWRRGRRRR